MLNHLNGPLRRFYTLFGKATCRCQRIVKSVIGDNSMRMKFSQFARNGMGNRMIRIRQIHPQMPVIGIDQNRKVVEGGFANYPFDRQFSDHQSGADEPCEEFKIRVILKARRSKSQQLGTSGYFAFLLRGFHPRINFAEVFRTFGDFGAVVFPVILVFGRNRAFEFLAF